MNNTVQTGPSYQGQDLMEIAGAFGDLKPSTELVGDAKALRERMRAEGYLYLPGLLDTERVQAARVSLIAKFESEGCLDPAFPRDEAVARPGEGFAFRADLANGNPAIDALLYEAEMMTFWEMFLGGPVRHFDYTWLRARTPGEVTVTPPHCDTVFMNRGTPDLYTTWTPLGDVPYELGGLMVLEHSHHRSDALGEYWAMDVDTYCSNGPEADAIESGEQTWQTDKQLGFFDQDALKLQREFRGRWLGAEYRAGDVLVFGMHTLHAAADNRTHRIRLSTDSRYQLASEPADERWVGPDPVGHGPNGKKGMIC